MRIRTGYSFRSAVGMIDKIVPKLIELKYPVAPITDRASTFGFVKWKKACEKAGIRPVFGVELAVSPEPKAKKPVVDYWTFIAKENLRGIHDLIELASNQFRYEPLLSYDDALAATDCIKIVGHRSRLTDIPSSHAELFVGWSPACSRGYLTRCLDGGFSLLKVPDNKYVEKGDEGFYNVICGRGTSTQSYPQHIISDEDVEAWSIQQFGKEFVHKLNSSCKSWEEISELCKADLEKAVIFHPARPNTLKQMCVDGAKKLGVDLSNKEYSDRLEKELNLIEEKEFEDYFYIIAEMVQWARKQMVVGPARGSSCGSLVCYLLEITTIDPIPYGLIFERFIDINRSDLPDIDIDFSDVRRELVFDHMAEIYGKEHVARLGTVALYKPKSALNETGAALDIPPWEVGKVTESLIERSGGDSRALQALEDTFDQTDPGRDLIKQFPEMRIAQRMEGHPRHHSQHAAGIVLTDRPVKDYVAVDARSGATMCDKYDAEELNLLKIDALGLTQLSVFEDCLEMAGHPMDFLDSVPLDDKKAFDILNDGHFSGIFQYNGDALQSITKQVKVEDVEDIISITALGRPGPLNTGGTLNWIKIKNGVEQRQFIHKDIDHYLDKSNGIIIYQEQVMQIGRSLGELSWEDVSSLRKAMSKSLGEEFFNKYAEKFVPKASEKIGAEKAKKLWDSLCAYGSWAFNRSHAVAYGLISYWCCWLKAHHPVEYAAAMLSHENDIMRQISILREMKAEGVDYVPVDAKKSTNRWEAAEVEVLCKDCNGTGFNGQSTGHGDVCSSCAGGVTIDRRLVGPLHNVKGIGPKLVGQILGARERGEKLPSRAQKLLANPVTPIDSLYPVADARKRLLPDPRELHIFTEPTEVKDIQQGPDKIEYLAYGIFTKISPKDENEQISIEKRGHKLSGPTTSLGLRFEDDTDSIYAKINRFNYERWGRDIVNRGGPGKHLYCIKGFTYGNSKGFDFRMLSIEMVRYIGEI